MMTEDLDGRFKALRRDLSGELDVIGATLGKITKTLHDKSDNSDTAVLARRVSDIDSDMRDMLKGVKSEMHDTRQSVARSMEELRSTILALSDSLSTYRREADGKVTDTVTRMLNDRKPPVSGPVWAAGGGAGAGILSLLAYLVSHAWGQ
jgi:hypothetical protein